jgi:hypothetical protein|tara:strand:+ start:286 stop:675 length:390 start_codon:yes stop_codon:yes gene_type:complete
MSVGEQFMRDNFEELEESFYRQLFAILEEKLILLKKEIDDFKPNLVESELYLEYTRKRDEAQKTFDELNNTQGVNQTELRGLKETYDQAQYNFNNASDIIIEFKEYAVEIQMLMTSAYAYFTSAIAFNN